MEAGGSRTGGPPPRRVFCFLGFPVSVFRFNLKPDGEFNPRACRNDARCGGDGVGFQHYSIQM